MGEEYALVPLREEKIQEVLSISWQELGEDFHSESDFARCLSSPKEHFCEMVLNAQKAVCGFAKAMIVGSEAAQAYLKLPAGKERDRLLAQSRICIIDALAIDNTHKRMGLGRLLADAITGEAMEKGVDVFCGMAWKSVHGGTNAAKLLLEIGLRESLEIAGYWNHVVNSPDGHHCPVCGEPPCKCYGVLYTRYLT
jgi:ribosomal protein S18 acetylase RimI-like enzyme